MLTSTVDEVKSTVDEIMDRVTSTADEAVANFAVTADKKHRPWRTMPWPKLIMSATDQVAAKVVSTAMVGGILVNRPIPPHDLAGANISPEGLN